MAAKQQAWDVIHGNAIFDDKGTLIGGAAYSDQQRQITAENTLRGAGMETPAMKMDDMQKHIASIQGDIAALLKTAQTDGIKIADEK